MRYAKDHGKNCLATYATDEMADDDLRITTPDVLEAGTP
jgi:hypothetical protein